MYKLTLSVDESIASRAKRYAEGKGTSVSELVERFLDVLSKPAKPAEFPELKRLRGILKGSDPDAYRKHWAHTTLGVVAARNGDVANATQHLRESASVGSDFRLSSYGPSFLLARELCALGEWDAAAAYLQACAAFWNPEPLRGWVRQLRERKMPEPFEN